MGAMEERRLAMDAESDEEDEEDWEDEDWED